MQKARGCSLCESNKYRTGDASPQNNECKPIPAGANLGTAACVCWCQVKTHGMLVICRPAVPFSRLFRLPTCAGYKAALLLVGPTGAPFPLTVNGKTVLCDTASEDQCQGAYTITACDKGTVSKWDNGARVPLAPKTCGPCTSNTYAPRTGECSFRAAHWLFSVLAVWCLLLVLHFATH